VIGMKEEASRKNITHPGGVPMPCSESLLNYEMYTDDGREASCAGDWLWTLDAAELRDVFHGLELFCEGPHDSSMDDMLCLVLQTVNGESGGDVAEFPSPNEGPSQ